MKISTTFLCILTAATLLTGCSGIAENAESKILDRSSSDNINASDDKQGNDESMSDETMYYYSDDTPVYSFETRFDKIQKSYPDKSILIWVSNQNVRYEDEVNKYLSEHDSDYVICFKNLTYDVDMLDENGDFTTSYAELLEAAIDNSEQIDIIDTGFRYQGCDPFCNPYQNCVDKGWLEPIGDYLENTECGKETYDLMPENYWKSLTLNGEIYGIDGSLSCLKEDAGFTLNARLVDDNGIDIKELSGSYADSIEKIIDLCEENDWKFSMGMLQFLQMYSDYDFITDCIYIDNNGNAANIYESDFAKELFGFVSEGYNKGVIINSATDSVSDPQTYLGTVASSLCAGFTNNNFKTSEEYGLAAGYTTVEAYRYYPCYSPKIYTSSKALGVCSSSSNKDLAFEAICEIMTNEELNNLICFGTDYEVIDGCISPNGYYNTMGVENRLIRMPFYGVNNSESNEKFLQALTEFELSANIGFDFDTRPVSESLSDIESLLQNIDVDFPSDEYKNGEEYLEKLNDELYDAGLQDILDEANRQLKEWR